MDPHHNIATRELFSRSGSPPGMHTIGQPYPDQQQQQRNASIESLFHNLTSPATEASDNRGPNYQDQESTTPTANSLMNMVSDQASSVASPSNDQRHNALLSLLGGSTQQSSGPVPTTAPVTSAPQQIPTPPGSAQRNSPMNNEAQGKLLLEQLMAGATSSRSNYSDNLSNNPPSPSYSFQTGPSSREPEYRTSNQYDLASEPARETASQQFQSPQNLEDPPSPRKSMFEFVSPFDALSSTVQPQKKKAPPPPNQPSSASSKNDDSASSWTAISDPKRQSVDNLLEHLTRGQPLPPLAQAPSSQSIPSYDPPSYDPYSPIESLQLPQQARPPVLTAMVQQQQPAGKANRAPSPRFSPPRNQNPNRPLPHQQDSPIQQPAIIAQQNYQRTKESSPSPRGLAFKKGPAAGGRNNKASSPQAQSIIFDVSQVQEEVQVINSIRSTPIALVKQDPVFLPGTTIGATHWVAYAMTRGRVRVISRSSGDRTLLQLPPTFPPTSSVTDMAVHSNRLAGVTSDGGFVVWELPEIITDDVPGTLILSVPPSPNADALHSVKWHPKDPETLAVASDTKVYLIDLTNTIALGGQPLPQSDLHHIGQVLSVPSPLVALDFDVPRYSIATISEDSTLMLWNIEDRSPYSTYKVRGEDIPSSLTFVDGGIVIGRKNGTIFQLWSTATKSVLSTLKFVNGAREDPEMFGHVNYDSRIQTLWIANCRRNSIIALKIGSEPTTGVDEPKAFFEQVVEFVGPKPTIHFVILDGDADPTGEEAHAACIAAKETPGEVALVAFSVHSSGVDQVLVRKEWYDNALITNISKFPSYVLPQQQVPVESKTQRPVQANNLPPAPQPQLSAPVRVATPPSEEVEASVAREEPRGAPEGKGKSSGKGGKNAGLNKDKDENVKEKEKASAKAGEPSGSTGDAGLAQAIAKEIRKSEENLHTRIGRLIGKEMDKQHQRFEDARAHDHMEDFARQEKILKLIANELTRNTTRVVETAVKSQIENTVLPSLENITKHEVKTALNEQMTRGLTDYVSQSVPVEMERLFRRPDVASQLSKTIASTMIPLIETNIKDALTQTFVPLATQQTSAMHADLLREFRSEIYRVKNDLGAWQSDAFRSQEKIIRNLEHSVQSLSDQVKFLGMNSPAPAPIHHLQAAQQGHNSPGSSSHTSNMSQQHIRAPPLPPTNALPSNYISNFPPPQQHVQPQQPAPPTWYGSSGIAAPQASHPASLPQPPPSEKERTPPIKSDQWDDIYLSVLHTEDTMKLRDLLSRTNPEVIMPLHGSCLVSQAVILTLVHRLSAIVGDSSPTDESYKTSLWWLQRSVTVLDPSDKLITDFIPRVIPTIQKSLNTTRQRISILPGGPLTADTARTVADISETLRRKMMPVS